MNQGRRCDHRFCIRAVGIMICLISFSNIIIHNQKSNYGYPFIHTMKGHGLKTSVEWGSFQGQQNKKSKRFALTTSLEITNAATATMVSHWGHCIFDASRS